MIYTPKCDDILLLSQWIKKNEVFTSFFFGCFELSDTNEMCLKTEILDP